MKKEVVTETNRRDFGQWLHREFVGVRDEDVDAAVAAVGAKKAKQFEKFKQKATPSTKV